MIVVLFKTKMKPEANLEEYNQCGERMYELVQQIPGFLSLSSYSEPDGAEVTIAYFASEQALDEWRTHSEHLIAQQKGRSDFYQSYSIQVCTVAREYEFDQEKGVIHHQL